MRGKTSGTQNSCATCLVCHLCDAERCVLERRPHSSAGPWWSSCGSAVWSGGERHQTANSQWQADFHLQAAAVGLFAMPNFISFECFWVSTKWYGTLSILYIYIYYIYTCNNLLCMLFFCCLGNSWSLIQTAIILVVAQISHLKDLWGTSYILIYDCLNMIYIIHILDVGMMPVPFLNLASN